MPLPILLLRHWLALAALALGALIVGIFVYIRLESRNVLKSVPAKMSLDIQQTAEGFRISKSDQGRTLFTVQASRAVQFKQGGRTELHNVTVLLYGRDASRYDRIYGNDFEYDPRSGDITAKGEVLIDLEANPKGILKPDQSVPTDLKNPIHLRTRDLVFNQKTGNAFTRAQIEFQMPQATGSAEGAHYTATDNVLTLDSQVHLVMTGATPASVTAARAQIEKTPRRLVLDHPQLEQGKEQMRSEEAVLFLRENNAIARILATGTVQADAPGASPTHLRADQADLLISEDKSLLRSALLTGDVQFEAGGDRPANARAGRVLLEFVGRNLLHQVHAEKNVKLVEPPASANSTGPSSSTPTQLEVTAPVIDFFVAGGSRLDHATTSGAAHIAMLPVSGQGPRTLATAGKFEAKFDNRGRLASVHGTPEAKIVSSSPGQPDRISTSQSLDATFSRQGGIESIVQQGSVVYADGERRAWADRARYTPADQVLTLDGSPRVTEQGMTTTARTMRMNRATGDAFAEDDVKSTYSDLREQPDGSLLASSSPIHVTARNMTVHNTAATALYTGDARLWQDANVVEAPSIQFDRDHRSLLAQGDGQPVTTVLVQVDRKGNATPVSITAARLTYEDDQHRAHLDGGVVVRGADVTITARQLDAFLLPRNQASEKKSLTGQGQLDRIIAEGKVVVQEPSRRATGEKLVYAAAEDRFVLTGGSPSIFDAEHGKITGVSLTFYNRDDRVLVEGRETSPAVTQTRVAR